MSADDNAERSGGRRTFFLTGLPKSGTTWMMNMLNGIEGVLCLGEGRFVSSCLADVPSLDEALRAGLGPWYGFVGQRKRNWLATDDLIRTVDRRNVVDAESLAARLNEDASAILAFFVRLLMKRAADRREGIRCVGDKTPVFERGEVTRLAKTFPGARIVFLERGVQDFVVSLVFHYWRSVEGNRPDRGMRLLDRGDFEQVDRYMREGGKASGREPVTAETAVRLAEVWRDIGSEAREVARRASTPLLVVPYESLLRETASVLTDVLAFLGVPCAPEDMASVVRAQSREAVQAAGDSALQAHIRSGEPGEWVNHLSAATGKLVAGAAGDRDAT